MNLKQKILVEHLLRVQIEEALRVNDGLTLSLQGHYSVPKISVTITGESKVGLMFNIDEEITLDDKYDPDGRINVEEARLLIIDNLAQT